MSDSSSSPPGDGPPSPPSPGSDSSPPTNNSDGSPPSPSSDSSPPPPSQSGSSPPSPDKSLPEPDSSPPPPNDGSSSSSPPPPDESTPPPSEVSRPPPSDLSPSFGDSPPTPDAALPPTGDPNPSPSDPSTPVSTRAPPTPKDNSPDGRSSSESTKKSHSRHSPSSFQNSPDSDGNQGNGTSSGGSKGNGTSSGGSKGNGTIIGLFIVGVLLVLIVICFVSMKRRRRKTLDALDYHPPTSIAIRADGNYYRQAHMTGGLHHSDSYNLSQPHHGGPGAAGGSNRYGYHSGLLEPAGHAGSRPWFSYEELTDATDGFSRENMIGEGGFGCVYKGALSDGRRVAVKQLKAGSGQGEREFQAEVEIISRVHHRHLVSLVGYCIAEYHRLLVYEFLPNNTLEHHLHGKGLPPLEWSKRMKIAIGSAKGLAYLHEDCHPRIIHRDIKSANILLEDSFEPQVADFGLAKLSNDTHTHVSTRVMGTFGYLAPEYASSGKLTDRSDVFSFGVVLLELITGRKPVDSTRPYGDESLVEWARPLLVRALETGNCDELVDPRLENNYNKTEMFNMIEAAAACVRHSAPKRPRMVQVVRALDSQDNTPDLTNGVKYGQSQAFNPSQSPTDMERFRLMAFGNNETGAFEYDSGDYDQRSAAYSGEFRSREHKLPLPPQTPPTRETDTRPIFQSETSSRGGGGNFQYHGRGIL